MTPAGVAILGATGSIGRSAIRVIERHPERFRVAALSAHRSASELDRLAARLEPDLAVLSGKGGAELELAWQGEWGFGEAGLAAAVELPGVDIVLNALVGIAGLGPTLRTLETGKRLALANKESLVTGGELALAALGRGGGELVPVDSEHSAIHQCVAGRAPREIRRLILTASGGPFREHAAADLASVGPDDALAHPTWDMGSKITVDSATLANKALEVIEAHYLFGVPYERIEVVVHPTSIVHSMVELCDGSVLAQLGRPTMEVPILYALSYPERLEDGDGSEPFDPVAAGPLEFEPVREDTFPMFRLGIDAGRAGGRLPVVYNAANEVAVAAFLGGRIAFPEIPELVRETISRFTPGAVESVHAVWEADEAARTVARAEIGGASVGTSRPPTGDSRERAGAPLSGEV